MKRYRKLPYGYLMAEGEIRIHPQERDVVTAIFEQYLAGVGPVKIATLLNERGVCFQSGSPTWNKCRLYRILSDERYAGAEPYPQIISADCLAKVKERISSNRTYSVPVDALARRLGGIVNCSCGEHLKRDDHNRWRCCGCGKSISSADLERGIKALMLRFRDDPGLVSRTKSEAFMPTGEIMRMTSEIARSLNSKELDEQELRRKILNCARLKYEAFRPDVTEYIKKIITEMTDEQWGVPEAIADAAGKIASEIIFDTPGSLRLRLKNGAVIRNTEEDTYGNSGG